MSLSQAYLPFQDYGCQVLIRVIRVKNVISFQGYFEQIPLISFFKRTQKGGADFVKQRTLPWEAKLFAWTRWTFKPLPRTTTPLQVWPRGQRAAALQASSLLPHRSLEISFSRHLLINRSPPPYLLLLHYCHPIATTTALNLAKDKGSGQSICFAAC